MRKEARDAHLPASPSRAPRHGLGKLAWEHGLVGGGSWPRKFSLVVVAHVRCPATEFTATRTDTLFMQEPVVSSRGGYRLSVTLLALWLGTQAGGGRVRDRLTGHDNTAGRPALRSYNNTLLLLSFAQNFTHPSL